MRGRKISAKPKRPRRPAGAGAAGPPKGPDPAGLVTRAEAAARLGVAPARINRWAEDGAPVAVRGARGRSAMYDLAALRAWKQGRAHGPEEALSLAAERAKLARAQREKWETFNRIRSGQLVERSAAVTEGRSHIAAAKARLLSTPRQAVMRGIITRENEPALRALILEALRELGRWRTVQDSDNALETVAPGGVPA